MIHYAVIKPEPDAEIVTGVETKAHQFTFTESHIPESRADDLGEA